MIEFATEALTAAVGRMPTDDLAPRRRSGLEHFLRQGFPTTRLEDWKYTDLAGVIDISNRWLSGDPTLLPRDDLGSWIQDICSTADVFWIPIVNGVVPAESITSFDVAGVSISSLGAGDLPAEPETALAALNAALLHDGLHIEVSAEASLAKPLGLLIIDSATDEPSVAQARVQIDVASGAELQVFELHKSVGDTVHYANTVIRSVIGENARLDHVRLQQRGDIHSQTHLHSVSLADESAFEHASFDLGGKLVRNDLNVDIAGKGASATFNGLYIATDKQHIDNHTRVDHRVGPAQSTQEYRGILRDNSRCVWNGKAIVHAGADGTDAKQANHNLLLSDGAEIDAKPELEIYADDVKCSHGTTVGSLDEDALFYLRSRGLSRQQATDVLTRAFATRIVTGSPIAALHEMLTNALDDFLDGSDRQ